MSMRASLFMMISLAVCGCTAKAPARYQPPQAVTIANEKTVNAPFADVWTRTLPKIGQSFFVINNIEKDSGFLNLSYSGDPGLYVDCGTKLHTGKGGPQTVHLSNRSNTVQTTGIGGSQVILSGQTKLDTKINVVFVSETETTTKVSVNVQYEVHKLNVETLKQVGLGLAFAHALSTGGNPYVALARPGPQPGDVLSRTEDTVTFKTGQTAPLQDIICGATGQMERDILSLIE